MHFVMKPILSFLSIISKFSNNCNNNDRAQQLFSVIPNLFHHNKIIITQILHNEMMTTSKID